ncbi:MAG: hypothetical protein ACPGTS_01200 [Minisyncoccia bacterium]
MASKKKRKNLKRYRNEPYLPIHQKEGLIKKLIQVKVDAWGATTAWSTDMIDEITISDDQKVVEIRTSKSVRHIMDSHRNNIFYLADRLRYILNQKDINVFIFTYDSFNDTYYKRNINY